MNSKPGVAGERIIPADAGSTRFSGKICVVRRDHPRGCGEHIQLLMIRINSRGSSPRMRGARILAILPAECIGIIPADAGSTALP